jgi:hypothetical protein
MCEKGDTGTGVYGEKKTRDEKIYITLLQNSAYNNHDSIKVI